MVGLTLGWLTQRLLRLLRWHGASASQVRSAQVPWGRCASNPLAALVML